MANICTKIKLYAKSKGVDSIDFLKDVIVEQLAGQAAAIKTWNLSIDEPTADQLNSFESAGNTDETLQAVLNKRASEYLSWQQQMEMIYKDQKNGTTTFKNHCDKVRSDNPKE
jgi:DNA-binding transcriptional regulator YbjK